MINLGFYIKDLSHKECVATISQEIDRAKAANELLDASIFFDDIGPVDIPVNAGFFNSTDIWNFTGDLVVFSLDNLSRSLSFVNNFDVYYCFGFEPYNVLQLLKILDTNNVHTIVSNESSAQNFYRVTGRKPISINENLTNIPTTIMEHKNE